MLLGCYKILTENKLHLHNECLSGRPNVNMRTTYIFGCCFYQACLPLTAAHLHPRNLPVPAPFCIEQRCLLVVSPGVLYSGDDVQSKLRRQERQLAIVNVAAPVPVAQMFTEPESDEKLSVVPTTTQYIMATGKQALALLQTAAGVMPVPLLQDAISIAMKIIEVCEEASAVEQKVKELQERVGHLMIVIVNNVTVKYEEDVKELLRTLKTVDKELTEVRNQNEWLQGLYTNLNMAGLESCINQLSTAQEKFQFSNELRDSNLLLELHGRLSKISTKIDDMHRDVKNVGDGVNNIAEDVKHMADKVENISTHSTADSSENCVWVPCIEATSAALFLEIVYIQLQVPGDKRVTLENIIFHLDASKQPRLLLLDNFETPWNAPGTGTQKQMEDILRQLAELNHIAIFMTMRGTNPPCSNAIKWQWKNIQATDEEACLRIYHDNNPSSKGDPDVGPLLAVLGYMPFAVTLMAKLGMEGESTAKELLDAWRRSGPDIFRDKPEDSMNRSIRLSVESEPVKRNPDAYTLLAILSLLPAGSTRQNLHWWAPDSVLKTSMIPSAVATLSKASLLMKNPGSPVLFVVPVVQSFMQQHGRIEEKIWKQIQSSCCQCVLDHACRHDDPTFPDKSMALAAEDTNIQSILIGSRHTTPSDRTIETLIAFSWHRCDTKPHLEIANQAAKAAKASGVKRYTISAVWCLGWAYQKLGDYRSSYDHLQEAHLLSSDPPAGDVELQRLHCKCGIDLVEVAKLKFEDKGKAVSLARDVESKCAALSDDHIHGWSLVLLGDVLDVALQRQEALVHLNRAQIMLKAMKNTLYISAAYQIIARLHYHEQRFPEALEAIQKAWSLIESNPNPSLQADISFESGLIYFSIDRDTEAWRHAEVALMKGSHIGDRIAIGRALQLMAMDTSADAATKTHMVPLRPRLKGIMVL